MHVPINVKSPNNISKWQMGFNSAFKGLIWQVLTEMIDCYIKQNVEITVKCHRKRNNIG
jgi:hypothetical protein